MSSIIKVNTVQDTDGNNIINESGSTVTIGKAGNNIRTGGDNIQAADGGNLISQSGTTITLGASGDTVEIASGASLVGGGISWQSTIVTGATHTASANQGIWIDTTSNACNLTLPSSPSVGNELIFSDFKRTWGSNAVTLTLNGSKFQGFTSPSPVYDTSGESVDIVFSGSTKGWIPNSDGAVAFETPQTKSISYLVIAGGGGGGYGQGGYWGGGGGAGGYRNSFASETSGRNSSTETSLTLNAGVALTITVGTGGAGGGSAANGTVGNASSMTGTGVSITSTGGGYGAGASASNGADGGNGGAGGGGADGNQPSATGGSGTASQGFDGGGASSNGAGGGGGAGAAGTSSPPSGRPVAGGAGLSSSITGSAVTRGVGGSGSVAPAATKVDGTGNGGDGSDNVATSDGADGIVILRMSTVDYSGTTTGSPTVDQSTVSGQTILIYTGSGSYTS